MSVNPTAMYAATQHGSLQNADAVIDDLVGVLSGFAFNLTPFDQVKIKTPVALEVEDVFFAGEPVVVRARPKSRDNDVKLRASLWLAGESQPGADKAMETAADGW